MPDHFGLLNSLEATQKKNLFSTSAYSNSLFIIDLIKEAQMYNILFIDLDALMPNNLVNYVINTLKYTVTSTPDGAGFQRVTKIDWSNTSLIPAVVLQSSDVVAGLGFPPEPANLNIQAHIISSHAPTNAQKNSDITKAEIEAKLTGVISTHSHPATGGDPYLAKLRLLADVPNATLTPVILTGMNFAYEVNSVYIFQLFLLATSAAATTGYGYAVDTSSVVTYCGLHFNHQLATGGTITGGDSIADNVSRGLSSGVPAVTVINSIMGSGSLIAGANAGTAQFMFRPEVAASATTKAGSVILVMKIN